MRLYNLTNVLPTRATTNGAINQRRLNMSINEVATPSPYNVEGNEAVMPTREQIAANFDDSVSLRYAKFSFRTTEEEVTDSAGKPVLDGSGKPKTAKYKRPSIELHLPVPSMSGVIEWLSTTEEEHGEEAFKKAQANLRLLGDVMEDTVTQRARDVISDDGNITGHDNFDLDMVGWNVIANLPKSTRRGGGIPKESWEAFIAYFKESCPAALEVTQHVADNLAKVMAQRLNGIKLNKPAVEKVKARLVTWMANAEEAETHAEVCEFLIDKANTLLEAKTEQDFLAEL